VVVVGGGAVVVVVGCGSAGTFGAVEVEATTLVSLATA
jgi:uncharacterized phage protein gp47/JayE